MSKVTKRGPRSPQMNMTPMIDVTFQLIIFFMLVNNIVAEESVTLTVPKLFKPQVRELDEGKRVVVNVLPGEDAAAKGRFESGKHPLDIDGHARGVKVGMKYYLMGDLQIVTDDLKDELETNPEVQVIVRADAGMYYDDVQLVLAAVTKAGIKRVHLVAYKPEEGPPGMQKYAN